MEANEPAAVTSVAEYEVGDVVASCDFDNSDGLSTGCINVGVYEGGETVYHFSSTSDSVDTGPTADHTGDGGKYWSESRSRNDFRSDFGGVDAIESLKHLVQCTFTYGRYKYFKYTIFSKIK